MKIQNEMEKLRCLKLPIDSINTILILPALTPSLVFLRAFQLPRDFDSFLSINTPTAREISEHGATMPR